MSKEPDLTYTSDFDAFIDGIVEETATFVVRLTDGRPPLVFRKTRNWDDLEVLKARVAKVIKMVQDRSMPATWKPFIGSNIAPVGHAVWFADRHVGYLKWFDCEKPETEGPQFRKVGEQWQEERIVEAPSSELTFIKMSAKDPHGFQSLHQAFFENVGVGWTSTDAAYFRKEEGTVQEEPV